MLKICDEYRLVLSVVASIAGIMATVIFPIILGPDIVYAINKFFKSPNLGEKPDKKKPSLWFSFYISCAIAIAGGSVIAIAPSSSCVEVTISYLMCDPPGDEIEGEYVEILNEGSRKVKLEDWTLCDSGSHHCYIFGQISIESGEKIRLWTKTGIDTNAELYWGNTMPIWNNIGDTAQLRDAKNIPISELSCSE